MAPASCSKGRCIWKAPFLVEPSLPRYSFLATKITVGSSLPHIPIISQTQLLHHIIYKKKQKKKKQTAVHASCDRRVSYSHQPSMISRIVTHYLETRLWRCHPWQQLACPLLCRQAAWLHSRQSVVEPPGGTRTHPRRLRALLTATIRATLHPPSPSQMWRHTHPSCTTQSPAIVCRQAGSLRKQVAANRFGQPLLVRLLLTSPIHPTSSIYYPGFTWARPKTVELTLNSHRTRWKGALIIELLAV